MMIISARSAATITEEPREHLQQWRIFTLANGDRHLCGVRANGSTVRVSSKLVLFDAESKNGMTQSGRIYQLDGPPGDETKLRAAVAIWCHSNRADPDEVEFTDV